MPSPSDTPRLLLTGATGFFGRALLRHLRAAPTRPHVVGLSREPGRFLRDYPEFAAHPGLELVRGDIMDPASLETLPAFDAVLHAATDSTLGPRLEPLAVFDQIVTGTRHVVDLAVRRGVRRLLLTSSGGIYGPLRLGEPVREDHSGSPDPLDPRNAYSCGKRAAEHLCSLYRQRHSLECVIARCFAFIGEDLPLDVHFAAGNFIRDALAAPEITVTGDGRTVRSYVDQHDLAEWLLVLLERGQPGRAYNVGSGAAITLGELARLTGEILAPGKPVRILGQPSALPPGYYVPDVGRVRDELGLVPRVSLEHAIRAAGAAARLRS